MYNIQTLNKLSTVGTDCFDKNLYNVSDNGENADGIIVRSASMHEMEMPKSLLAIARAGAGVNNIPLTDCANKGIVVFNTPGANANAVKELVIAGLLLSSRKVMSAIDWAKTLKGQGDKVGSLVEKGKGAFVGPEITGKTLGVVGLGAIGILVANAAKALGMNVYGYDPFLSVKSAWGISQDIKHAETLDEIYANCDYITVHVPLTPDTKEMINKESIAKMKDSVRILNFARGDLVNSQDVIEGLESKKVGCYVTDFPSDDVIGVEGVVAIPHLGASTPESEDNCAYMAAQEIITYLETGNIVNSVNMPNLEMPKAGEHRICVIHKNVPAMISQITTVVSETGLNIENMANQAKKDYAYTMIDVNNCDINTEKLEAIEGVIRVRVI